MLADGLARTLSGQQKRGLISHSVYRNWVAIEFTRRTVELDQLLYEKTTWTEKRRNSELTSEVSEILYRRRSVLLALRQM